MLQELAANAEEHYNPFWKAFLNAKERFIEWPDDQLMLILKRIRTELLVPIAAGTLLHECGLSRLRSQIRCRWLPHLARSEPCG